MANVTKRGYIGFDRAVHRFEEKMIKECKRVVAETAEMMATQMKSLAPVSEIDGGNLRRSIEVTYYNNGLSAMVRVGAEYGVWIEWGTGIYSERPGGRTTPWVYYSDKLGRWVFTRGMRSQPFYRPSFEKASKYFTYELNRLGV